MSNKKAENVIRAKRSVRRARWILWIQKILIGLAAFIRLSFQLRLPIYARPNWIDDDGMIINYALNLLDGEWLGEYSRYTLNKMPGFSLMLAFFKRFGIPYMLGIGVLWVLAALVFYHAIKLYNKSFIGSYLCYLFVLFCPILFDDKVGQQIYRMSVIPIWVLFIVSCYLIIFFQRKKGIRKNLGWMILAGFSYMQFVLAREDSIWFKCFVFGATFLLFVLYFIDRDMLVSTRRLSRKKKDESEDDNDDENEETADISDTAVLLAQEFGEEVARHYAPKSSIDKKASENKKDEKKDKGEKSSKRITFGRVVAYLIFLIIPIVMAKAGTLGLKAINYKEYGLFTTNDFSSTYYASVCGDLLDIKPDKEQTNVDVSFSTLMKACDESPTMDSIRPKLKKYFKNSFPGVFDNEIHAGYFKWLLRYAVADAGYYTDAAETNEFYRKIHEELTDAFVEGRLEKRDVIRLSTLARPLQQEDIMPTFEYAFDGMMAIATYRYVEAGMIYATGGVNQLEYTEGLTSSDIPALHPAGFFFSGNISSTNKEDALEMHITDKYGTMHNVGIDKNGDFYITFTGSDKEVNNYLLQIYKNDKVLFEGSIADAEINDKDVTLAVEDRRVKYETIRTEWMTERDVADINSIIAAYVKTSKIVALIAAGAFALCVLLNIVQKLRKKKTDFASIMVMIGMLATIFADAFIIGVKYAEASDKFKTHYASGTFPIWCVFVCFAVCCLVKTIINMKKEKLVH